MPKLLFALLLAAGLSAGVAPAPQHRPARQSTGKLPAKGLPLFNGRDLRGWHADVPQRDKDPATPRPFIVRQGLLVSLGTPGGHLITDAPYQNYRLEIEYRFAGQPGKAAPWCTFPAPGLCTPCFPSPSRCS